MMANMWTGATNGLTEAQKLAITESDIIRQLAFSPCVLVGRSAAGILRKQNNVLRVFIQADEKTRMKRSVETYGDDPAQAAMRLKTLDKRRAAYFKANAGVDWKQPEVYHLMLNSGLLDMDTIVAVLECAAAK